MEGKQPFVLNLPPGYHFAPTDMELIVHYLRRKMDGHPPHLPIFKDVPITDYRPEQITEAFMDCGEDRWYFFTKRSRKYATGNRPDRTTPGRGYWKATGPQRLIRTGAKLLVGRRRTLVFYTGPDEEAKTAWTMYEYENLTSEEEANDKNADKLGEWVLCTIQRQKSPRGGDEGKAKAKAKAGGRKRKGKAQEGADQALQVQGPEEVVPEMAWPEEGDEMGMFELEQASCPSKRPRIMQQHEPPPPCPETMMPAGDYDYGPLNMAPPSQEPAPRSEAMMMASHCGGSYNNMGSAGIPSSSSSMAWPGPQLSDSEMVASRPGVPCFTFEECMMLMASPVLGVGYNGYSMATSQPATSYLHAAPAPLGAFEYGDCGAAHQPAGHLNNSGYAGRYPGSLLGTSNSTYTYPQQHSYAAGTSKLASSNSTYTYLQQHSHAAGTNKLAPSSSTYTYQQQHSHPTGTTKAAGTNKLASSSGTYQQQQHSYAAGTNKADGTSNLATSNSTYTCQQQHSCAAETNKLALVRGAMSSGIGQGSDEQPQVEV